MGRITVEYALEVKAISETLIVEQGGEVNAMLPYLDRSGLRSQADLIGRALALNAIIDLNYDTETEVVKDWVQRHGVAKYLTPHETSLLDGREILQHDKDDLAWLLDALWALMWAGGLVETLDFTKPIPDGMYALMPHVSEGEGPEKFSTTLKLRSFDEIYRTLDLYYRLQWYTFQNQIRDELGTFDLPRVLERRRALEWLLSPKTAWDRVSLNT